MKLFFYLVDGANEIVGRVLSWAVVLIMLITVYDVALRYVFGQPTLWAFDVVKQLYAIEFMTLAGFGLLHNKHVAVDVITVRLNRRQQAILEVISYLIFFLPFAIMLIWKSYEFAARSWVSGETTWGVVALPVYPIKTTMVVASVLLLLQGIAKIIREVRVAMGEEAAC